MSQVDVSKKQQHSLTAPRIPYPTRFFFPKGLYHIIWYSNIYKSSINGRLFVCIFYSSWKSRTRTFAHQCPPVCTGAYVLSYLARRFAYVRVSYTSPAMHYVFDTWSSNVAVLFCMSVRVGDNSSTKDFSKDANVRFGGK